MPYPTANTLPPFASRHPEYAQYTWPAWLLMAAAVCLFSGGAAWAQNSAAKVMSVSGLAKAVDTQGRERVLEKGAELFTGDKVQTSDASLVQVRMNDGGYLSVRANTELVIDQFVYDEKDPGKSNFLVSLLRGGFRSITGLIGRVNPGGYQIRSSTATIGIRGTDHEPVLVLDTPEAQLQTQAPPGLYDKVNDGETFISSKGGVLALRRGDVGFAPLGTNLPPQVLLKVPDFYKIDLKTDARDPKDGGSGDGNKGAGTGNPLRPSVAARREAQAGGASGTSPAPANNTNNTPPTQTTQPPTAPTPLTPPPATTKPLTTEQRRAILQAITPTAPNNTTPTTTAPSPTAPNAPVPGPR